MEIPGRNRHSKMLLGVMYYSEHIQDFQSWLDKTENLFSQLSALWDGLLVIAGDTNIDLMNPEATNTKKFLDMLNSLNLHQHVQCVTRTTRTSTIT